MSAAGIIAAGWVRHSMEARTEPNDHDLANAEAALTALAAAGYAVISHHSIDHLAEIVCSRNECDGLVRDFARQHGGAA